MRGKLIAFALFCVAWGYRWHVLPSPLPTSWTPESRIGYTARILEQPEHTDSKTVIRQGIWTIKLKGYQELNSGEAYRFVGKVEPLVLLGKTYRIEMVDPTFENVSEDMVPSVLIGERVIMVISRWREKMVKRLENLLPEPHASLSAGILLGVKRNMPWEFYEDLVETGTLHIVAASGYNVSIVAAVVMRGLSAWLTRGMTVAGGMLAVGVYVILAGADAAVVRAGIMGSLTLMACYLGRPAEARRLLALTAGLMLILDPLMLVNVGFELSVAATGGLLYLQPYIEKYLALRVKFLREYLYPTVAATAATLPVTLLWFGRISLIGPVVNVLVLPVVPLIMLLSALALVLPPAAYLLYVPLAWVVGVVRWWG